MSLLQTTAEEEQQNDHRSTPSTTTAATVEATPVSGEASAGSLDEIPINARHVRPDELMAALAAIDARKNATVAGTVPLGNALEQMQADVTPDEVWLEVYAGRLQQRKVGTQLQTGDSLRRKRFWVTGGAIAGVFVVAILLRMAVGDVKSDTVTAPAGYMEPAKTTVATPPKLPTRSNFNVSEPLQFRSRDSLSLAQLVRENRTVRMELNAISSINSLLNGNDFVLPLPQAKREKVFFDLSQDTRGDWLLHFHEGRPYLRGWVAEPPDGNMTRMLVKTFRLFNDPTHPNLAGKTVRQITIPVRGVQEYSATSDGMRSVMDLRINRLDGQAWKRWEAPPLPDFAGYNSTHRGSHL